MKKSGKIINKDLEIFINGLFVNYIKSGENGESGENGNRWGKEGEEVRKRG
jgi:hypothetical protein